MKIPRKIKRYCKFCKKHTEQKVSILSTGGKRGSLKKGSMKRAKKRGLARGTGNKGRWGSKPAVNKWKRRAKSTQRKVLMYKCAVCGKSLGKSQGIRTGRLMMKEK
ncbi:MAG: 50S ribosomal protein L44e [archaeon]|nr:MAG: 50S ribosomal protein L44e [archaeon]